MRYTQLEHTADAMVRCTGRTLEECFENAAYALSDQTVDADKVEPKLALDIEASGEDLEERLFNFLSEVLYLQDAETFAFADFEVRFDGDRVIGKGFGEPLDLKKHHAKGEVKAVTYHMMEVDPDKPQVTVVFDM